MTDLATYMRTRRSALSMTLEEPGPDAGQIRAMVEIASRVPDHGKLAPWRFVHYPVDAREKLASKLTGLLAMRDAGDKRGKWEKQIEKLTHGPCLIAVVSKAAPHDAIPEWEQQLSSGAAAMNLLIAANALGFEAQWLTAWYVYDAEGRALLGLEPHERVAGLIHIGTSSSAKSERPRPAIEEIFSTFIG